MSDKQRKQNISKKYSDEEYAAIRASEADTLSALMAKLEKEGFKFTKDQCRSQLKGCKFQLDIAFAEMSRPDFKPWEQHEVRQYSGSQQKKQRTVLLTFGRTSTNAVKEPEKPQKLIDVEITVPPIESKAEPKIVEKTKVAKNIAIDDNQFVDEIQQPKTQDEEKPKKEENKQVQQQPVAQMGVPQMPMFLPQANSIFMDSQGHYFQITYTPVQPVQNIPMGAPYMQVPYGMNPYAMYPPMMNRTQ